MAVGILMLITQEWIHSSGILSFKGHGNIFFMMTKQPNGTIDITFNILIFLFSFGALLAGFSREKIEDEFIAKIRLFTLSWSGFIVFVISFISGVLLQIIDFSTSLEFNDPPILFLFLLKGLTSGMTAVLFIHAILFNISIFKNSRKEVEA